MTAGRKEVLSRMHEEVAEEVSITEAAQRLGVSDDTVRRRLRVGQLEGRRERTPRGYRWLVQVPPFGELDRRPELVVEVDLLRQQVAELREFLAVAREELAARRAEVQELLAILRSERHNNSN